MSLRHRCAPKVVAALLLTLPIVACEKSARQAEYGMAKPGSRATAGARADFFDPTMPPDSGKHNTESHLHFVENGYVAAATEPKSTFSASVDTAAYTLVRSSIERGQMPAKGAVRVADMLNFFEYAYPKPQGDTPLAATLELAPCPWNPKHHLLRIALATSRYEPGETPPRNLVFLLDTSGSMQGPERIGLVKQSLMLLVDTLTPQDRVSLVTYAGDASVRLESTPGSHKPRIKAAIAALESGGSTNGAGGIHAAYAQAAKGFITDGVNRVILATDGDFNVGVSSDSELVALIEEKRKTGVYLTVLGYGRGNLQDAKMEQLSRHGNGNYAYIDDLDEARRLFVEQGAALATVAKDVKLQVEFNHNRVHAYRLIGYENRLLKSEDFRNDDKDAGDLGSGHTVTALYEIVPPGVDIPLGDGGDFKYQGKRPDTDAARSGEWLTLRMRYKHPDTDEAREIAFPLDGAALRKKGSDDFRFAAAVTAFGLLLRDSPYKGMATWESVREAARTSVGSDESGRRKEFLKLVDRAERLAGKAD